MTLSMIRRIPSQVWASLFILMGALLSLQNLAFYLRFDFNLVLTLMALPVCLSVQRHRGGSWRYGLLSLSMLALYPLLKVQSLFFLGFCSFVLFIIDNQVGRINYLPLTLLLVSSPFAFFAMEVIGFPLRLELTQWAAFFCRWFEPGIVAQGNRLLLGEEVFSVDPECMGLKLMNTSLVLGLTFLAFLQRQWKKRLPLTHLPVWLLLLLLLVLGSNLIRMVLIVFFRAMPETALHEIIGLVSWIVYALLPLYGITYVFIRAWGKEASSPAPKCSPKRSLSGWSLALILLVLLAGINQHRDQFRNTPLTADFETRQLPDFSRSINPHQVVQYQNDQALIYVKPGVRFYGADHTPLICWKGSGYQFRNEAVSEVLEKEVFTAELIQDDSRLYTAWWYDNGHHQTISQWDWRWRMAQGEPSFRLINVTCASEEELHHQLQKLFKQSLIPISDENC